MTATTKLALELLQNNAANQTLANITFAQLNQLVQSGAADRTNTPPGSPVNETLYIVTATATGAWAGKENQLAYWLDSTSAWQFVVAREGFLVHVNDEDVFYKFDGSSWAVFSSGGGSFTGGTLTTALNEATPATVASASTTNIGAADRNTVNITGTTTITAFDTIASGAIRRLVFGGALTLTHNGTSLILPTGANITTAAGDVAEFLSLGSGNWRCVDYTRANGQALSGSSSGNTTQTVSSSSGVLNLSSTTSETLLLTTSENVTSISWPSGVAGQSIQRRLVVTQGGAGNYTLPSTTANWGSITVDGGGVIPQPLTGVGSSTTYVLVNDNNTGWRMYLDNSRQSNPYATAGGTANALTLSINHAPSKLAAYAQGDMVRARVGTTNTGAMTLSVDGLSAVAVKTVTGADTPAGYIRTDVDTQFTYNGTYWEADRRTEYGSNADGQFWRYSDGFLKCINPAFGSLDVNTASGALYVSSAAATWTFPAPFASGTNPVPSGSGVNAAGRWPGFAALTNTSCSVRLNAGAQSATTTAAGVEASGRWY